jgi:transcriptional regulator with XRE-family HTH domain
MNKILFSERLAALRKSRGFSTQYALAAEYDRRFPTKRHDEAGGNEGNFGGILGTLKRYENANLECGLDLTKVCNLCSILDCDIDYLLGKIDVPHHETADVMGVTGLSEAAVIKLCKYDSSVVALVDFLLSSGLVNPIGLKASQCVDVQLELAHYTEDVLPALPKYSISPFDFTPDEALDAAAARSKVLNEVSRLREKYDADFYHCTRNADTALDEFINHQVQHYRNLSK